MRMGRRFDFQECSTERCALAPGPCMKFRTAVQRSLIAIPDPIFQGFTDPDYASMYITSNDCEMDEGDADNPDRITTQAFASIKVRALAKACTTDHRAKRREIASVGWHAGYMGKDFPSAITRGSGKC